MFGIVIINQISEKERNIQKEGDKIVNWFDKNDMICSGDKTKLLIVGTRANRKSKLENRNISLKVDICGDEIKESNSEKLLGVVINNNLTWREHIYGDAENIGLLKNLSKRIGILKKLRSYIPNNKFIFLRVTLFFNSLPEILFSNFMVCI